MEMSIIEYNTHLEQKTKSGMKLPYLEVSKYKLSASIKARNLLGKNSLFG